MSDTFDGAIATANADHWMRAQIADHVAAGERLTALVPELESLAAELAERFAAGGILYTFGNGGSAADAQHFTGELIGHYKADRRPLPAVTLSADPSAMTCIANDYAYDDVFARQVEALARPGDVVAAFTTSGRSPNVVGALRVARERGARTVLFAAGDGGPAREFADRALLSPAAVTPRIQETHTFMLHVLSEYLDAWALETGARFGGDAP